MTIVNARDQRFLPDIQSASDPRNLPIQRVGVRSLTHPIMVATAHGPQPSVASVDMAVALPGDQKGTHMSRFIDVLQSARMPLSAAALRPLMQAMLARLDAAEGSIELRFPYFIMKSAPVSGVQSLLDYQVTLHAEQQTGVLSVMQKVAVPVTSLCPCSKKVSDYGAHNQRSMVTIALELAGEMPIEEQVRFAEQAASCELYGLLKRPDEKYVTERAYDNPKFVEDIVRDVALELDVETRIGAYVVESENFESIHNHSAYALIEREKQSAAT